MRTVSTVFCWITFGIGAFSSFIYLITLSVTASFALSSSGAEGGAVAAWIIVICWIVWAIALAIQIAILRWRNKCLDNGEKGGCGVVTLIFVSLIGGILTLCIPDYEINPRRYYKVSPAQRPVSKQISPLERAQKISIYDEQLNKGVITKSEYDRKVALLDDKTPAPQKPSESEKVELIQKYKKLLDDGVITQEEFDKKKADLLR